MFTDYHGLHVSKFKHNSLLFLSEIEVFTAFLFTERMNPENFTDCEVLKKMKSTKILVPYYFLDGETLYIQMMQKMVSFLKSDSYWLLRYKWIGSSLRRLMFIFSFLINAVTFLDLFFSRYVYEYEGDYPTLIYFLSISNHRSG